MRELCGPESCGLARFALSSLAGKAQMKRNVSRGGIKPTPFYMGDPAQQNRSDTQHRSS